MEWLEESSLQMGLDSPFTLMLTFYYHDPDNEVAYLRPSKVGIDLSPNQKKVGKLLRATHGHETQIY